MMAQASTRRLTGRQVLFILIGFFGVMLAANLTMVYFAMDSWTGLTAKKSYAQGLQYNQTLADADRQRALGWALKVDSILDGDIARLRLALTDKSGAAVDGLTVESVLQRPTHENDDHPVSFARQADGTYLASVPGVAKGNWKLFLTFNDQAGQKQFYRVERLWLN